MSNSASHSHDAALTALAVFGFIVASYLALYQWGVLYTVWEPLFGTGSRTILHSSVSHMLPIPDAALGAAGYLVELICVSVRQRTSTWVGYAYNAVVIIFFVASLVLVALQWGYFHAWCTLCLLSALTSFAIAATVARELVERRGNGRSS